jgi:hypothetical protein
MRRNIFILILFTSSIISHAQIIKNKSDIFIGYGVGTFPEASMLNQKGFIAPSLYSNFSSLSCIDLKFVFHKRTRISLGTSLNYFRASDWKLKEAIDFNGSKASLYNLTVFIQFHNRIAESGFFNRAGFYIDAGPSAGISSVYIPVPPFNVESANISSSEKDLFYGARASAGVSYNLSQVFGVFLQADAGYFFMSPKLYTDDHFGIVNISAGLILRLVKDKKFYY